MDTTKTRARGGRLRTGGALAWALACVTTAGAAFGAELPARWAIDLLAGAARGVDMNEAGEAVGVRYVDTGCGSSCLAPEEIGVWTRDGFRALPWLAHWSAVQVAAINASGWVVGTAHSGAGREAVLWRPVAGDYEILELGTLPGSEDSVGIGIDDLGRVVGHASSLFPPAGEAFTWNETDGMVGLSAFGFPTSEPRAISPGGTVAYLYGWYQLDVPGVVTLNAAPPPGHRGPGYFVEINDSGDQVRFLGPTSGENLNYLFRYLAHGQWQLLWPSAGSDFSPFGVGSITAAGDVTATVSATGLLAAGPDQAAESLTARLSPAYGDAYVTEAGPIDEQGEILAQVMIGRSPRLVRLVPPEPCASGCLRVASVQLNASGPNRCTGGSTRATATVRVTDETGAPLRGVRVTAHFFDDYALDELVEGTTSRHGTVRFRHRGPPCVGAIALLVTDASMSGRAFDRLDGTLQAWAIPD